MQWVDLYRGTIKLQKGDVVLTAGAGVFGKIIRWGTNGIVNHTAMVTDIHYDPYSLNRYKITEALFRVTEHSLFRYDDNKSNIYIFRHKNLIDIERDKLVTEIKRHKFKFYSPLRIFGQTIDKLIGKIIHKDIDYFDQMSNFPFTTICSTLVSEAYEKIGITFGEDADSITPQEIMNWVLKHSSWELIFWYEKGNYTRQVSAL
jgi:hypothetical protein